MASRGIWRIMSARTRKGLTLAWTSLFLLSLLLQYFSFAVTPVLAVHDEGLFELDGNATSQAAPGDDWDKVKAGTSAAEQTRFITDAINSTPDEHLFTGGKSKDGELISDWRWTSGPGVQDKNDIEHAFAAAYTGGTTGTDSIVYFGLDRYAQSGDAFVGFWFLKDAVSENANGHFNGAHQDGDILVQVNFTNGGAIQDFKVSDWSAGGLHQIKTGVECTATLTNDDVCGKVNGSDVGEIVSPWSYTPKSGTADNIPEGGFFEAGINLTGLNLDQGCFSTFLAETRSSQSLTSTLSDYATGSFSFCTTPEISTQVKQGTTSLGSNGSITIGESVTDTATLSGDKGTVTGTIDFFHCFNASATPDCTTGGTKLDPTKTLSGGAAISAAFTPGAIGHYCFRAEYTPATGSKYLPTSHTNTTTECFTVAKATPSIATSATESVNLLESISDTAVLSNATDDATGTITFNAYGPGADCSGSPAFTATAAVSGNGTYGPVSFSPSTAGVYHWIASYDGDAKNASATGACLAAGENDTVKKLTPSISTQASGSVTVGGAISDTATVSGGHNPTGTVTFALYGPADQTCAGNPVFTSADRPLNGGVATSAAYATLAVGTYHWIATYNGDANNATVAGACSDANENVVVTPAHPTIATVATESGIQGDLISDTATVSGGFNPSGTVTFSLYGSADPNCTGTPIFTSTVPLGSNGIATSGTFAAPGSGTYHWIASYSGDANNASATGACGDAGETTTISQFSPNISTVLHSGDLTGAKITVLFGSAVTDQATLTGAGPTAGGTVSYRVFSDDTCQTQVANAGDKTVTNGSVPASDPVTFPTAGTYYWQARYSGDANNAPKTSLCTDEVLTVTTPNLHAVKLVGTNGGALGPTSTAVPGDILHYQITITNSGNAAATNVPFSDDIAAILAHATYNNDCSDGCSRVGTVLNWTIPSIAAGGSEVVTFSVTLDATFPTGTTHLPNVVIVTGPGSNCAAESTNADCDTDTTVASSALEIAKSFTGNTAGTDPILEVPLAKIGDTLHYTLAYTGGGPLTNAVITDVLPVGLDYVVGSAAGDASFSFVGFDAGTRTLTWHAATLPIPASGSVTYDVVVLTAAPEQPQPLTNTATIHSDETAPDSDTAQVAVLAPPLAASGTPRITPPPTDAFTPETGTSNPGFTLMLILLGLAGLAVSIGFVTPTPERVRRRDRRG